MLAITQRLILFALILNRLIIKRNNIMIEDHNSLKSMPPNAFLVVNSQVFPLDRELTNIGRKLDNHVVIHDPRVSRTHAQVRIVNGQYLILDLDSTGGTFVNGQRVTKSVLYSNDAISLSGVPVKFVQDAPKMISQAQDRTGPLTSLQFEEPPTQRYDPSE